MYTAKAPFDSPGCPVWAASVLLGIAVWAAGARRRNSTQPRLHVAVGDPTQLITKFARITGALAGKGWRAASEAAWHPSSLGSLWAGEDASLLSGTRAHLPRVAVPIRAGEASAR